MDGFYSIYKWMILGYPGTSISGNRRFCLYFTCLPEILAPGSAARALRRLLELRGQWCGGGRLEGAESFQKSPWKMVEKLACECGKTR